MQKLLLQHAKNMYREAMRKFPSCTALRIQYAFFLLDHLGKKQEAKAEFIFTN
jgi:predicted Zn-dependent protease